METQQQQCLQPVSKLPLRIIEYIWAHRMADVLEGVDPSDWPDVGSQPLSLEDSGRLRVVSARVYSIVKNRDKEHFERAVSFLEDTHRLLPTLVSPIKHMKVVFGLKTMIIMWMLAQEAGMMEIMFKINQFFPIRLPQYQNQCSQHEMFLMKKNHMDFKDLAQSLAMDKVKLERYVLNQMQEQYGEHYAQKVEDRLLQYLQKLETVLPGDAYIDKILKKEERPVSEEEKILLEVVSSDSATIAATLRKLLQCVNGNAKFTLLDLGKELEERRRKGLRLSRPPLRAASSLEALNFKAQVQFQGREEAAVPDIPVDVSLLLKNEEDLESRPPHRIKGEGQMIKRGEEVRCGGENSEELYQGSSEDLHEAHRSPQFCSKHQRWVKSILQECPEEERSDDGLRRANVWPSPPLFPSSSSRAPSQDLTLSGLVPCPADQQHPTSDPSGHLQTPGETCEKAYSPKDQKASGSSTLLLQPASYRDTRVPVRSPTVQLIDLASVGGTELSFKLHSATTTHHREASVPSNRARSSPPHQSSGSSGLLQGATSNSLKNNVDAGTDPGNRSSSTSARPAASTHLPRCPSGSDEHLTRDASTSPCQPTTVSAPSAGNKIAPSLKSSQRNVPVDSIQVFPHARGSYPPPQTSSTPKDAAGGSPTGRSQRAPLRLSLPSQAVLLRSKLLQPRVSLSRLSSQHCYQATNGRSSNGYEEPVAPSSRDGEDGEERRTEEEESGESSFELNFLYSSFSSSSGGEDSTLLDPDYKPCIKKKRLLLEYEVARNLL